MKNNLPVAEEKKITVIVRVEPGCLGPEGNIHVDAFCSVAQTGIEKINSDFINWQIVPRFDKSLPEFQYKITDKLLTHDQAIKYLKLFDKEIDELEEQVNEEIAILIDQHLGH